VLVHVFDDDNIGLEPEGSHEVQVFGLPEQVKQLELQSTHDVPL
jgi:hypothetical protein